LEIRYTAEFKRNIRGLGKKYRHLRADLQPVLDSLRSGGIIGDQIPGTHYPVFKVRAKNSDIQKGKSSGYRLIYWLKTRRLLILVTIYSKLEQKDVSAEKIRRIIRESS